MIAATKPLTLVECVAGGGDGVSFALWPAALLAATVAWQSPCAAAPSNAPRVATVTAYCRHCSGATGCRDNALHYGDIAADPAYYPYGTRVYLQGYGVFTVRDTGSKIKGRGRFDIYRNWGGPDCLCGENWGCKRLAYRVVGGR